MLNSEYIEHVIKKLKRDLSANKPKLANSPFTMAELRDVFELQIEDDDLDKLAYVLNVSNVIRNTVHYSLTGQYFCINESFYEKYRRSILDKQELVSIGDKRKGFCILRYGKIYTQGCEGRGCRFYLHKEHKCVLGKYFCE